jgi:mRNA interferase MazF
MAILQGEVWWAEAEDKRRPVLIVTRSEAIPVLNRILIAPLTKTIRLIPTEVQLGPDQGLPVASVASFDNLQLIGKGYLTERLGMLTDSGQHICRALSAMADC